MGFWSSVLGLLENNHLNLKTLRALRNIIHDPILIIGAGHGLLVEELQQQGHQVDGVDFCSAMVQYAEQRRGLKLVQADAVDLPFPNNRYNTTVIATGVIDFLDDERRIRRIIDEASRVTQRSGKLLAAFYRIHPAAEKFLTRIGVITAAGTMRHRRVFELSRQDPLSFIATVRKDGGLGTLEAIIELVRMQFSLPKQERVITRNVARILKSADNANELIESVAESIPYRNQERISALFRNLDVPVNDMMVFEPCVVVDLGLAT